MQAAPRSFYRLYTVKVVVLMALRWIYYRFKRWHYYMIGEARLPATSLRPRRRLPLPGNIGRLSKTNGLPPKLPALEAP